MIAGVDRSSSSPIIFFISFQAVPTALNPQHSVVEGAYAACWIVAESPESAYAKARFFVAKDEWEVVGVETPIAQVIEADFEGRDTWEKGSGSFSKGRKAHMLL